jgi:hypothetical protein
MQAQPARIRRSAKPESTSLNDVRIQAAAIVVLVVIAYANALDSSFHFDDSAIFANPSIVSPGFGWDLFRLEQTRPLTYLTFHWNFLAGGQNPVLYHWINLLLHAANSILVLALARRYLRPLPAACVAMVFALHPIQTESVTYVFARSTLLCTHFALWTTWLFVRGKYAGSALLFGLSLLAKEETIALPGFLLLFELFERRRPKAVYFAILFGLAALAASRLFYLIAAAPLAPGVGRVHGVSTAEYLLTQFRVLWIYLRLMIAPIGLNLDRDVPVSKSLLHPATTLAGALALLMLVTALIWLAWRKQPAALWALGFFVLIAPSSSIVAQADMMYEHRTYLPMVCAVMALGYALLRIADKRLTVAVAILVPLMLGVTVSRNADWQNEKILWTDIAEKSPNKGRSWLGLAGAFADDPLKQREYLIRGLAVDPNNAELHTNYGIRVFEADPEDALAHFQKAMALVGETADRWNNIGGAYFKMNDREAAIGSFQNALRLDPCNFGSRRNLMMVYSQQSDPHRVWQMGEVPSTCTIIPSQREELEMLRHRAGQP